MLRVVLPVLATVAIVAPLVWLWQASRVPAGYSVMEMGYLDYGGGATSDPSTGGHGGMGRATDRATCPVTRWRRHGWSPTWWPTRPGPPMYGSSW